MWDFPPLYRGYIPSDHYPGTSEEDWVSLSGVWSTTWLSRTIIALIKVFPPSANVPAVAASAGDEAVAARESARRECGDSIAAEAAAWKEKKTQ